MPAGWFGLGPERALRVSVGLQIHLLLSLKIQIHTIALLNKMQMPLKMGLCNVILKEQWTHSKEGTGSRIKRGCPGQVNVRRQEEGTITGRAASQIRGLFATCTSMYLMLCDTLPLPLSRSP